MKNKIDGATVEVVRHYLVATAQEMRATLIRTAFNPVIYEVLDFGISIYNRDLDLIAEAPGLTMFLGANDYSIQNVVDYMGKATFEEGDVAISNYPTGMPRTLMMRPFWRRYSQTVERGLLVIYASGPTGSTSAPRTRVMSSTRRICTRKVWFFPERKSSSAASWIARYSKSSASIPACRIS